MTQDLAAIAAELGTNAKQVVKLLDGQFRPAPDSITRQQVAYYAAKYPKLIKREWQDGCANCTYYCLTPIGLSVRQAILEEQDRD